MAGALAAHSGEDIYYRTDHHWTSLGAFYGANAIFEAMSLDPLDLDDYQKTTVTDQFFGTTFSTSGVRWVAPDSIDTYVSGEGLKVTSWFGSEPSEGLSLIHIFLHRPVQLGGTEARGGWPRRWQRFLQRQLLRRYFHPCRQRGPIRLC